MSVKSFHLHLVSDATGETVITVARGAVAQFSDVEAIEHLWSLVRSKDQLKRVLSNVAANPGVVMFTLVDQDLRQALQEGCRELEIPCIPLLDMVIAALSQYLGVESQNLPGSQHVMDAHYLGRIDAMNFTLQHDDGQSTGSLEGADIVLVGVSRSSKTPTCFYLANRGFKTANVPVVPGCPLPPELEFLKRPLVIGLTCGANQLVDIRRSRLRMIGQDEETEYVDPSAVREEVLHARRMFSRTGWPVIDVTNRSIEETAAAVLQFHAKHIDGED